MPCKSWNQNQSIQLSCSYRAGESNEVFGAGIFDDVNLSNFRTDAGVHALNTTAHINLEREAGTLYNPMTIVMKLNQTFGLWNEPIRILNARLVRPDFVSRRDAINRTYLYRLAVHRKRHENSSSEAQDFSNLFVPIEEHRRCHFLLYARA